MNAETDGFHTKALHAHCPLAIVGPTFDLHEEGNSDTLDYTINSKSQREYLMVTETDPRTKRPHV